MAAKLLPLVPEHLQYVEPFFGGGSLFFAKRPAAGIETINDMDTAVVDLYRVLRDENLFKRFEHLCSFTPYSQQLYKEYRENWSDFDNIVERVYRWFFVARTCFSGNFGSGMSTAKTLSRNGMSGPPSKWIGAVNGLPEIHERLSCTQIECKEYETILDQYCTDDSFAYLDPPYPAETRRSGGYVHDDVDHSELLEVACRLRGKVMISSYENPMYDELLLSSGWEKHIFTVACSAAARTRATGLTGEGACADNQMRTEVAWMNYQVEPELDFGVSV